MIGRNKKNSHGAVLLLVLGMLMVLSIIVSLFLNDVMRDTFMRIQLQGKDVLRHHAYNVLESLMGRLEHDTLCDNTINFQYFSLTNLPTNLPESIKINVSLTDESGKIPLNHTTQKKLKALFCLFGDHWDGQAFMQEYWKWLSRKDASVNLIEENHWPLQNKRIIQARTKIDETSKNETENKIKFPKMLLSYDQLREIDKFRAFFFDEKGQPNQHMERLKACSSLWNTGKVNINSASKEVLDILSKNFPLDLDKIENHLGLTETSANNPQLYKSLQEMNELGHANFTLTAKKEDISTNKKENASNAKRTTVTQEQATSYLTVQPHTICACISIEEADLSFQLNALIEISVSESPIYKKQLTNQQKNSSINKMGCVAASVRSLKENFL